MVENWHATAFTSFGDGHGVWESTGGTVLPFYARNFTTVKQWVAPVAPRELLPTILALQSNGFRTTPESAPQNRQLTPQADRIQSYGIELARALTGGHGLVWAAVEEGQTDPAIADLRRRAADARHRRPGHQPGPDGQGQPAEHAGVRRRASTTRCRSRAPRSRWSRSKNQVAWTGTTNADGVAIAPALPLRGPKRWYETKFEFLVTAEKDGDIAYLGSDWTEGIDPWEFGINYDSAEQHSLLRGTVFADRGVYRLGEEVHYKAILRHDTASGIKVPDAGTTVYVSVRDSQDREIDQREVKLSAWGSVEWTQTLPAEGALGNYCGADAAAAVHDRDEEAVDGAGAAAERRERGRERSRSGMQPRDSISGGFLVAAYRRPDFRVDATLTSATPFAGTKLTGSVTARYLFGAPMKSAPVRWTYHAQRGLRRAVVAPPQLPAGGLRFRRPAAVLRPHRAACGRGPDRRRRRLRGRARDDGRRRRPLRVPARGRGHRRVAAADRQPRLVQRASRPRSTSASSCPTSSISRPG